MRKIAIVNQKGGVGKSVTSVNLAIGLARQGKKVIAIDLDAKGSLTVSLGFTEQDGLPITISTLMERIIEDEHIDKYDGILHHEESIDPYIIFIENCASQLILNCRAWKLR